MTVRTRDEDDSAVEQDSDHPEDGERREPDEGYLDDIEDGCGCAEVWEHLSEHRAAGSD